ACSHVGSLGLCIVAAPVLECPSGGPGERSPDDATAVVGELADALDERLGICEVELLDVSLGERHGGVELLVLPFRRARCFERELRPALERLAVADPVGDCRCSTEGLEADIRLVVC